MALLPKVRLKAVVNFPSTIRDGTGIDVTKEDGHYQLDLAYDDFAPAIPGISDPTNQTILIWNSSTETYTLVPVSEFGVGGAITEAPTDGQQYGRQSSAWTAITTGGTGDVVGPASAVNDRIAVFNGVTGKLIKDGGTTIAAITGAGVTDGDKGNITVSGSGATWTIDNDVVTFAKMQNASAASVLVGRGDGGGGGDFQEITLGSNISMTGTVINVSSGTATLGDGDFGDITVSGSGTALTVDADVVTNTKLANMATARIKGRVTASTGDPEDLSGSQATTLLDVFTSSLKGLAPASGGGTTNFLRADGTFAVPPGSSSGAPLDALAYNGMQVNGSMEVSQEFGSTSWVGSGGSAYMVDGWLAAVIGAQVLSMGQSTSAPAGFLASISFSTTTANAAPAAGDSCIYQTHIEGYRISRLAWGTASAQPITIGFWVQANRTGTYSGSIRNAAYDRSYVFTFAISVSMAWEYKTVTIPGDTSGTWAKDNTVGLRLAITWMAGSTYRTATTNTWIAGTFVGANGMTNGVAATSDICRLTGVTILPGTHTITAAQSALLMRPYDVELALCQRYFVWLPINLYIIFASGGAGYVSNLSFPTQMRAVPTLGATAVDPVVTGGGAANLSSGVVNRASLTGCAMDVISTAAGAGYVLGYRASADARL